MTSAPCVGWDSFPCLSQRKNGQRVSRDKTDAGQQWAQKTAPVCFSHARAEIELRKRTPSSVGDGLRADNAKPLTQALAELLIFDTMYIMLNQSVNG